jgi:hypothetical protein
MKRSKKKLIRKWYKVNGKKLYSISDYNVYISVAGFTSRRKAEAGLKESYKHLAEYHRRLKEWRDSHA